jgi:zinc finger-containing ubiquitin peptidase 1
VADGLTGHSMTIIGFEKLRSGAKTLLVFDPMFHDATNIIKLIGRKFEYTFPDMALKSYRRGSKYLRRYREFEVLS